MALHQDNLFIPKEKVKNLIQLVNIGCIIYVFLIEVLVQDLLIVLQCQVYMRAPQKFTTT